MVRCACSSCRVATAWAVRDADPQAFPLLSCFFFQPFQHPITWRILPIPPTPALFDVFLIDVGSSGRITSPMVRPYLSWLWVWIVTSFPKARSEAAC